MHETKLKQIEGKLFIEHYPEPKPDSSKSDFWSDESGHFRRDTYSAVFTEWQQSVMLTLVHPSQEEAFALLAMSQPYYELSPNVKYWGASLQQGIPIPAERIEIKDICEHCGESGFCHPRKCEETEYAFLKQEKSVIAPENTKEESQDQNNLFLELLNHLDELKNGKWSTIEKIRELKSKYIITRKQS